MARPAAPVVISHMDDLGNDWQILAADNYYMITYQGRPVNIKVITNNINVPSKYKKTGYTNIGNCRLAVHKLNELFQTNDFDYINIGTQDEI